MKFLLLVHLTGLALLGTSVICEETLSPKNYVIATESLKQLTEPLEKLSESQEKVQRLSETGPQLKENIPEAIIEQETEPKLFHIVDVPDDENVDLGQMLGYFFGAEEDDDELEEDSDREGRAKKINSDETLINPDPAIILQYNNFVDAFLRQLTSTMKERSDPLTIILRKNGKISAVPKGKKKRKSPEDESPTGESATRPNRPKRGKNKNKRKNRARHPKDLSLDDVAEESFNLRNTESTDDHHEDEIEDKVFEREKREIAAGNEMDADELDEVEDSEEADITNDLEVREGRAFDEDYDDMEEDEIEEYNNLMEEDGKALSTTDAEIDEGRSDGKDIESRNRARRRRRRRRKGGKRGKRRKGKCAKKCQRKRRRRMRIRRRQQLNRNRGKRSVGSTAILSGLSLIRRDGDVQILQKENAQNIHANVEIGPVTLTAEKSFGEGDKAEQRKSEAMTPAVRGKIVINISKNGNANIKSFTILRPTKVSVSGSLRRDNSKTSHRFLQNYLTNVSPFVSKRMMAAANTVFDFGKTNENKNKNNRNGPGNKLKNKTQKTQN